MVRAAPGFLVYGQLLPFDWCRNLTFYSLYRQEGTRCRIYWSVWARQAKGPACFVSPLSQHSYFRLFWPKTTKNIRKYGKYLFIFIDILFLWLHRLIRLILYRHFVCLLFLILFWVAMTAMTTLWYNGFCNFSIGSRQDHYRHYDLYDSAWLNGLNLLVLIKVDSVDMAWRWRRRRFQHLKRKQWVDNTDYNIACQTIHII